MTGKTQISGKVRFTESIKLLTAVDEFAQAMKKRLLQKFIEEDFFGWDDPDLLPTILSDLHDDAHLLLKSNEPKEVDIANRAMFSWFQRR
ncbi:MAG: hypothetical protein NTY16_10915 [Deltaproteobacteria bacterium]|nr:hypothetical protein [Deltaproteobacteria bacterium]